MIAVVGYDENGEVETVAVYLSKRHLQDMLKRFELLRMDYSLRKNNLKVFNVPSASWADRSGLTPLPFTISLNNPKPYDPKEYLK